MFYEATLSCELHRFLMANYWYSVRGRCYVVKPHLRTREQVHVPLLVPRGPLSHLPSADKLQDVGVTVLDETFLPSVLRVRAVEAVPADGAGLQEDQRASECLASRVRAYIRRVCRIGRRRLWLLKARMTHLARSGAFRGVSESRYGIVVVAAYSLRAFPREGLSHYISRQKTFD